MDKFKLYGFISPSKNSHSFLNPVFEKDELYYIQVIGHDDIISGFEMISFDESHSIQGGKSLYKSTGEDALYGVSDHDNYVTCENKKSLNSYLRSTIYSYIDQPFFYKEVSDFCDSKLPEFHNCSSGRDYLLRQVLSNVIHEFSIDNNVSLEKTKTKINNSYRTAVEDQGFNSSVMNYSVRLTSKNESLKDTYREFFDFAVRKHKNIRNYSVVSESLDIADEVLGGIVESDMFDYTNIRTSLSYLIQCKLKASSDESHSYKKLATKSLRKIYSNHPSTVRILNSPEITTDSLSLIMYVTSRLVQEAERSGKPDKPERYKFQAKGVEAL